MKQILNPEMIEGLAAHFPRTNSASFAWSNIVSNHLLLRHLRGYWPLTSVDENGDPYDLSGQGRVLTNNNAVPFSSVSLHTYADLTPGSNHYFNRLDEVGLRITGGLTIGSWMWLDTLAAGADQVILSKWLAAGNQRSYLLYFSDAPNTLIFNISSLGTAASIVGVTSTTLPASGAWYHVVGRFIPSTSVSIFINGVETVNAVGVPASIFSSTANFEYGSAGGGGLRWDGRLAHGFICSTALEDCFIKALFWHSCPIFGVKP